MNALSTAALAMASVTLYVCFYHVFVYARRRKHRRDLSFAVSCLFMAGYDIGAAGLYSATSVADGAFWQYIQFVMLVLAAAAFLQFTADYTGRLSRRVVTAFILWLVAAAVFGAVDRSGLVWDTSQAAIKHLGLPFGKSLTYYEAAAGPVVLLQNSMGVVIFGYAALGGIRLYRAGRHREAVPLLAALALFFLGVFNDSAVSSGLYSFVYTIEYSYLSMMLLMAYSLSDELVHAAAVRRRLSESEERLRQAEKLEALGTLAGGVAHDFNNLLVPILGYAELTLDEMARDDPARGGIQEIISAANDASSLCKQLLAVSRKRRIATGVLDLNQIVREFGRLLRHLVRDDIEIAFQYDAALWPVRADAGQIHQILMNLAINASDAMPEGGHLTLETANAALDGRAASALDIEPGDYVRLSVDDSGTGIDPETSRRIFDPFFTTKQPGHGTGLGLATVRAIAAHHSGGVEMTSREGAGARFDVYLPRSTVRQEVGPCEKAAAAAGSGSETILLAEDTPAVRRLAARFLRKRGYHVLEPGSAKEALALGRSHEGPIHLLLTDVIMPRINGARLYEELVNTRPELRVVFMSGYPGDVIDIHGIRTDSGNFIEKPFTAADLGKIVREALDRRPDRGQLV